MADIRKFFFMRHFRTDPTFHVIRYHNGQVRRAGRGLTFWFQPMSTSVAEVPVDDRELMLLFHTRTADFQEIVVQGVVSFRVSDPDNLAAHVDFTLDLSSGAYAKQPLERLSLMLTQIAQHHASAYVTSTPIRQLLVEGYARIRALVQEGLSADSALTAAGIAISSVHISSLKPTAELEKALEMPTRERIQQQADEAGFARRAQAVENERAIQENELKNQIELARREQSLIDQRGQNELKRVEQETAARRIEAEANAERERIAAATRAEGLRSAALARAEGEQARVAIYRDLPQSVILGLAAQELASKLQRIDHLNLTPELLSPLLGNLLQAGTDHLNATQSKKS